MLDEFIQTPNPVEEPKSNVTEVKAKPPVPVKPPKPQVPAKLPPLPTVKPTLPSKPTLPQKPVTPRLDTDNNNTTKAQDSSLTSKSNLNSSMLDIPQIETPKGNVRGPEVNKFTPVSPRNREPETKKLTPSSSTARVDNVINEPKKTEEPPKVAFGVALKKSTKVEEPKPFERVHATEDIDYDKLFKGKYH